MPSVKHLYRVLCSKNIFDRIKVRKKISILSHKSETTNLVYVSCEDSWVGSFDQPPLEIW
jgi:hypothetical protein